MFSVKENMALKSVLILGLFGSESDEYVCSEIPTRPSFLVSGSEGNQVLQFVITSIYCTALGHATDSEA
jgi:hypothetical protein